MKEKKILGIGTAIFVACILVSSATAVQVSNKKAAYNTEQKTKHNMIEDLLNEDYDNLFGMTAQSDVDIEYLLWTLYDNQDFRDIFSGFRTNIINKINSSFSEDNQSLVEQLFHIEETFSFNSLGCRINNVNYDPEQLAVYIQDKLEVADDLDDLEENYEDDAKLLLNILYSGDENPDPESAGLHEVTEEICNNIASIYRAMIWILEPLLGAVGKVTAAVVYIDILLILLFPVIIPTILFEAALDALEHEPDLRDALKDLYREQGFNGLIAQGWLIVLVYIITEGYLLQTIIEVGKIIILRNWKIESDGSVTIETGQQKPAATFEKKMIKYKGKGLTYKYVFIATVKDFDQVEGNLRDMVQAGWDWDDDGIVDEWTPLSYQREVSTEHTYPTSGTKNVKFLPKDQWGCIGPWSEALQIFVDHPPNKPNIAGTSKVDRNEKVTFTAVTEDPENDDIYYQCKIDGLMLDFGKWFGPYKSGNGFTRTNEQGFASSGDHTIEVRAKDAHGVEGDWGTYTVTVRKGQIKSFCLFNLLNLERFPILARLLQKRDRV